MNIINAYKDYTFSGNTAVAIGKFDGVHQGHRMLIQSMLEMKPDNVTACAFTFDPNPDAFFGRGNSRMLSTKDERRQLLEGIGIELLVEYILNSESATVSPEYFVEDILVKQLGAKMIVAGTDVSFGHRGIGNRQLLEDMSSTLDYQLVIIDKVKSNGTEISSGYIREEIKKGNIQVANELLGYQYSINGDIVHGNKLGRTIGMPTVNVIPDNNKLLPPFGVYYTRVEINGIVYNSITNIGNKPTVNNGNNINVESYIYDFDKDVYGNNARISLLGYKRPEMKFSSIDELRESMDIDMQEGREYHSMISKN